MSVAEMKAVHLPIRVARFQITAPGRKIITISFAPLWGAVLIRSHDFKIVGFSII